MPSKNQDIASKLNYLNNYELTTLARNHNVKGYSNQKKGALVEKLIDHWDSIQNEYDTLLEKKKQINAETINLRSARTKVTRNIKNWVQNLKIGELVRLKVLSKYSMGMGSDGYPLSGRHYYAAKGLVEGQEKDILKIGSVQVTQKVHPSYKLCTIQGSHKLRFHGTEKSFADDLRVMPGYTNSDRSIILVTDHDDDTLFGKPPKWSKYTSDTDSE